MKKSLLYILASALIAPSAMAEYVMYINDGTQTREEKCEDVQAIKTSNNVVSVFEEGKERTYNAASTELTFEQIVPANDTVFITWGGAAPVIVNPYSGTIMISTDGDHVTVSCAKQLKDVVYKLKGSSTNGSFSIETPRKFTVIMENLSLASQSYNNSPIRSFSGSTMNIVLKGLNYLRDTVVDTCNATLRSKGQIIFAKESTGSLVVTANAKRAIQTGDYLQIDGGTIYANALNGDAVKANDYLEMNGGTLNVIGTGIEVSAGYAIINGGKISIDSRTIDAKGIKIAKDSSKAGSDTNGTLKMNGGILDITIYGGGSKGIKAEHDFIMNGGTITGTVNSAPITEDVDGEEDVSYAALVKADRKIMIGGGTTKIVLSKTAYGSRGLVADSSISLGGVATVDIEGNAEAYVYENAKGNIKTKCGYGLKTDGSITIAGYGKVTILGTATDNAEESAIMCARCENDININDACSVYFKSITNAPIRAKNIYFNGGLCISETESGNSACGTATVVAKGGAFIGLGYSTVITTNRAGSTGVIISDASYVPGTAVNVSTVTGDCIFTYQCSTHRANTKAKYLSFSMPTIAPSTEYVYTYNAQLSQTPSATGFYSNTEKAITGGLSINITSPEAGKSYVIRK